MDRHEWNERYASKDLVWGVEPNRFVAQECSHVTPGRGVDVACGEGRNAIWLARQGWRMTAVDFSEVAIDKGRRLAAAHAVTIEWIPADLAAWAPEPAHYDLVLVAYLQVPDPVRREIWRQAAAAVAPGGSFLLVGHDSRNLHEGYGGPSDPAVLYTADDVVAAIGDDLTVERAGEVLRPVATGETAIDCLVRAVRAPG